MTEQQSQVSQVSQGPLGSEGGPEQQPYRPGRRTFARMAVPVGVVAAVAAGVGLVPALADGPGPDLPSVTAEQLVAKVLGSQTQSLSGTVQLKADLGLPGQLLGMAGGGFGPGGGAGPERGTGPGSAGSDGGAQPAAKLAELLDGPHTVQVAVDGPDRQRIGLVEDLAGYELVHDGSEVWTWDSASNKAVHLTDPEGAGRAGGHGLPSPMPVPVTPQDAARQFLAFTGDSTTVAVDGTTRVAGRDAYRLTLTPKGQGSTVARVRVAVDAERGVPLGVQVVAASGGNVLDVHFSKVSFAKPEASVFRFTPPKGAEVTEEKAGGGSGSVGGTAPEPEPALPGGSVLGMPDGSAGAAPDVQVTGEGWQTVVSVRLPSAVPADGRGTGPKGSDGADAVPDVQALVKMIGKPVGGGTLLSTKVVNVLVTDDGRVFAGAVTLPVLQGAAGGKG